MCVACVSSGGTASAAVWLAYAKMGRQLAAAAAWLAAAGQQQQQQQRQSSSGSTICRSMTGRRKVAAMKVSGGKHAAFPGLVGIAVGGGVWPVASSVFPTGLAPATSAATLGGMPASMPVATSGASIPSAASASSEASACSSVDPSPTVASAAGIPDTATAWMAVLSAMSGNIGHANTLTSDLVSIGHGLPIVPKSLIERVQRCEFIDLAVLVPPQSVHDQMIETQARFALFEVIRPKRKQIESIMEWTKAYIVYVAALL